MTPAMIQWMGNSSEEPETVIPRLTYDDYIKSKDKRPEEYERIFNAVMRKYPKDLLYRSISDMQKQQSIQRNK
jgi:hypothetical protein